MLRAAVPLVIVAVLLALPMLTPPRTTEAAPSLRLPTPAGEDWRVIQGYGCGTHNGWDHYSLDLVRVNGSTYDAPVYAAADGIIWFWERYSGSLIISHGGGFFTVYTHLSRPVSAVGGRAVAAGEQIGWASDTGSPGVPHLHFTAYYASSNGWSGRNSVPLAFSDGYSLAELGGCNQHGGLIVRAGGSAAAVSELTAPPEAAVAAGTTPGEPTRRLDFSVAAGAATYSLAWNAEPAEGAEQYAAAAAGQVAIDQLPDGIHTLYVRSFAPDGSSSIATFGPVIQDRAAPTFGVIAQELIRLPAGTPTALSWREAVDDVSGVAGYRIYIGQDPNGTTEWYVNEPGTSLPALAEGQYLLRLQPIDNAGVLGEWTTYAELIVQP